MAANAGSPAGGPTKTLSFTETYYGDKWCHRALGKPDDKQKTNKGRDGQLVSKRAQDFNLAFTDIKTQGFMEELATDTN